MQGNKTQDHRTLQSPLGLQSTGNDFQQVSYFSGLGFLKRIYRSAPDRRDKGMSQIGAKDVERCTIVNTGCCFSVNYAKMQLYHQVIGFSVANKLRRGERPLILKCHSHSPFASRESRHIDEADESQQLNDLDLKSTHRRLYKIRLLARPLGGFFFSCLSTLGV